MYGLRTIFDPARPGMMPCQPEYRPRAVPGFGLATPPLFAGREIEPGSPREMPPADPGPPDINPPATPEGMPPLDPGAPEVDPPAVPEEMPPVEEPPRSSGP